MRDSIEILREANADAKAFAEGCDDLANAIQRALLAKRIDRRDLEEAWNRHHLRLRIIEQGLHHIPEDSATSGSSLDAG